MSHADLPVLWICGTAAAGKSVTAWALFEQCLSDGSRVAYLDIDQVGMLYPESDDDPERLQLKASALNRLIPHYRAAGAQALVVSGIVDPHAPADLADEFEHAHVTFCLLEPGETALRERMLSRGWDPEDADEAVSEATILSTAEFVDKAIDTRSMALKDVVDSVSQLLVTVAPTEGRVPQPPTSPATTDLVVITGARAVGTSTVGFGFARSLWSRQTLAGFVDLDQLNFLPMPAKAGTPPVGVANLAALHELFADRGASMVIASAHLKDVAEHGLLRTAFPNARVTIVRLRANETTLAEHVRDRFVGSDARLTGDDLVGASTDHQIAVVARALTDQLTLDQQAGEDVLIDVSGRSADDVISQIAERRGDA